MTKMSDLPSDLAVEILARTPVTSLKKVRSTCQTWNTLSKDDSFSQKHIAQAKAARESMAVMVMNYQVYLMSFDLHGIEPSINCIAKLISLNESALVYQCGGLLLCISRDDFEKLLVCNPYLGQTLWIPQSPRRRRYYCRYAIGYESSNSRSYRNYKVLRFGDYSGVDRVGCEIFDLNSNLWRVLDATHGVRVIFRNGVSLKGNTYWFATERHLHDVFLVCFDFTTERFGPRLALPFNSTINDTMTLSDVGEEQLAVLFKRSETLKFEIWVTSKIEPESVSWCKILLSVDMNALNFIIHPNDESSILFARFFVDVEKKLVVFFDKERNMLQIRDIAYIVGENGYVRKVDMGISSSWNYYRLICSYVPSLVQIK